MWLLLLYYSCYQNSFVNITQLYVLFLHDFISQSDEDQVAASVKSTVGEDTSVNQVITAVIPKGTFEEISNGNYFLSPVLRLHLLIPNH